MMENIALGNLDDPFTRIVHLIILADKQGGRWEKGHFVVRGVHLRRLQSCYKRPESYAEIISLLERVLDRKTEVLGVKKETWNPRGKLTKDETAFFLDNYLIPPADRYTALKTIEHFSSMEDLDERSRAIDELRIVQAECVGARLDNGYIVKSIRLCSTYERLKFLGVHRLCPYVASIIKPGKGNTSGPLSYYKKDGKSLWDKALALSNTDWTNYFKAKSQALSTLKNRFAEQKSDFPWRLSMRAGWGEIVFQIISKTCPTDLDLGLLCKEIEKVSLPPGASARLWGIHARDGLVSYYVHVDRSLFKLGS
jgi:hypothetical protein